MQAVSAGVAILAASRHGLARLDHDWGTRCARLIARRVSFGNLTVVVVSTCLEHSTGLEGANVGLLGELQEFLAALTEPFVAGAD